MNSISTALTSLNLLKEGISAAIGIRDFNAAAAQIAKMNQALIAAQTAALTQNEVLSNLQEKNRDLKDELRTAQESLAEKGKYVLSRTAPNQFAYRVKKETGEPDHYVCQGCFDEGIKSVLQGRRAWKSDSYMLHCPKCKYAIGNGEK